MKNQFIILILLMFFTLGVFAQTPEKINYQAVARDLSGNPLASQAIAVIIEVRQGSASGADVYKESHAVTTNAYGLFTLEIGGGTLLSGAFNTISWGTSSYYLYIEVDGNPIGASQLLSVPYALYSKKSLTGAPDNDWLTGTGVIYNTTDNVGIGTITPSALLDVGNGGSTIPFKIRSASNNLAMQLHYNNGTPGFEFFVNSADGFNICESNVACDRFFIQKTTGNIGIGTATPSAKLDVLGTFQLVDGTQGNNKILTSDGAGNASWQLPSTAGDNWGSQVVISSGSNISGNGTAGNPLIVTDSVNDADSDPNNERISTFALNTTSDSLVITEAGVRHSFPLSKLNDGDWTINAPNRLYNTTDLIGIGTTTPTEKLHIADGDPDLIVQDISGVGNAMRATIAFKDQVLGSVLDFGMKASGPTLTSHISGENISFQNNFGTGVLTRMIISGTNGYVGIGTSTPNSNLDISASGTQSQALNINFTSTASTGANNGIFSLVNNTAGGNIHSGYFQVQGSNSSTSSVAVKAFNTANSTLNTGIEATAIGTGNTNYGVFSYASGATNNWAGYFGSGAPGDGKVYVQDHLSVGTTSTSSTVNIVGSLQFQDGNQGLNKVLTSNATGNATWQNLPAAPISLWSTTTGSIYPSNITDKVGIGTTSPDVALNIFGSNSSTNINAFNSSPETTIRIYNSSQTNNNFSALSFTTLLSNSASTEMGKIVVQNVNHTIGSQQGDMIFMSRNSANLFERMRITGDGNIGIGTTAPNLLNSNKALTISANAYVGNNPVGIELIGGTNGGSSEIGKISFHQYLNNAELTRIQTLTSAGSTGEGQLLFYTNGGSLSEKMRINEDGNVGIGTTTPTAKLQVNGTQAFNKSTQNLANGGQVNPNISSYVEITGAGGSYTLGTPAIINGTTTGQMLYIISAHGGVDIFNSSATVRMSSTFFSMGAYDNLTFMWNGSQWIEMARSNNN